MKTLCSWIGVIAVVFVPLAAWAGGISSHYLVDYKELKKGAPAGTSLTFQLYTDDACTMASGSPVAVNVEDVDLIERIKAVKVKGGPKPPKAARLTHDLAGVAPEPELFLEVTGLGVTPVGSACQAQLSAVPAVPTSPGTVAAFAGTTPPSGWLLCDGSEVSRTTYAALFAVIGIEHGAGDSISTFNLPDYRGRFLRGVDNGAGVDPDAASRTEMNPGGATGDAVGSVQGDATSANGLAILAAGAHSHQQVGAGLDLIFGTGWHALGGVAVGPAPEVATSSFTLGSGNHSHFLSGAAETRGKNANVNYIIKY